MLSKVYIAGLFDGEGSISIRPQSSKRYLSSVNTHVGISMTHPFVKDLYEKFGGYLYTKPANKKHKKIYRWSLYRKKDIENFLRLIYPYLNIKKKQAKIMIRFVNLKTVSGKKRNPYQIKRAKRYIESIRLLNGKVKRRDLYKGDVE